MGAGPEFGLSLVSAEGAADTVYVDRAARGHVTDQPRDVAEIRTRFEELRAEALPPRAGIDLMAKVMTTWKQT
ncbi:hypothetical protein FHR32_004123 [Streptosporangium album]|uniref:DUF5753 domain-containing protein n=1 Tax=Streptosporangium album TaxID=47479 RepID=A0A7W7RYA7_9ACTN|nr:Scr1 family TA system antitoxin-like transcriptional regulator [Streptosporangium album]MBB4939818.1 hypothetical protein [Streptosporangium album]